MKMPDQNRIFTASTIEEQIEALTEAQEEESASSSLNARLLHDLYKVYDHASYLRQLEQSLERIGQRLEEKRVQSIEANEPDEQYMPIVKEITTQPRRSVQRKSKRAAGSPIVSRLASLAAVFFVALLVGSLLLTLLATRHHESNIGGNPEPRIIAVHMGPDSFLVPVVILHPGMSIQLVNDNPVIHFIENGYWKDGNMPVQAYLHEPGMPKSPLQFESIHETRLIGPFHAIGVYHLFDSIHVDMNLTIRVQLSGTPGGVTPTPVKNAIRVYIDQGTFRPRIVTIHKGMSILLVNETFEAIIMNGYWSGNSVVYIVARGKPVPHQVQVNLQNNPGAKLEYINGQGVPIVYVTVQPGNSEQLIGPFMTAGTFCFLNIIHIDVNLTVVVK